MTPFIPAYVGGALTILAPCILPVVSFVFARVDQPFSTNGLPLLVAMAATFATASALGAVAGGWAVAANDSGRVAAIALLSLMGVALLVPRWTERAARPLVVLASRISSDYAISGYDRERAFRALEVATLFALRRSVRNGSVWIEHSLTFRGRERLFLPAERWQAEAKHGTTLGCRCRPTRRNSLFHS